jgi:hypothetical protein
MGRLSLWKKGTNSEETPNKAGANPDNKGEAQAKASSGYPTQGYEANGCK